MFIAYLMLLHKIHDGMLRQSESPIQDMDLTDHNFMYQSTSKMPFCMKFFGIIQIISQQGTEEPKLLVSTYSPGESYSVIPIFQVRKNHTPDLSTI